MALKSSAPSSNRTPSRPLSSSSVPPLPAPLPSSPPFSSPSLLPATPALSLPSSPLAPTLMPTETTAAPCTLANASGSADAIAAFLDAGARVDPAAPDLPFHAAVTSGRAVLISLLAGSCPDPAWTGTAAPDNQTPVHAAMAAGNLDAVHLCVASGGGDPDRADSHGWTPLHYVAIGRYLDVAEFLIGRSAYDARLAWTRDRRKMPFDLAVDGGHTKLYDALGLEEGGMWNVQLLPDFN